MTKRTNFILILLARSMNLIGGFVFMGLLIAKLGMHFYGVFVFLQTIVNILFQFNHFYTSFLKLLNYPSGYAFVQKRTIACYALAVVLMLVSAVVHCSVLPFLATVILTVASFIYQAVFYHNGNNGIYNFILPFLNLFLYIGIYIYGKMDYYSFWMISAGGMFVILAVMTVLFIPKRMWNIKTVDADKPFFKRADRYVLNRSKQTLFFSGVTILQTNIDRIAIPVLTDVSTLGLYHAVSFVPYRLSMLWGSISALYSKEMHQGNYQGVRQYFKYGMALFALIAAAALALSPYILQYELKRPPVNMEYVVYGIFIMVSMVQSFGFICFNVYSYKNEINRFAFVNLASLLIFLAACSSLASFMNNFLLIIALSMLMSKVTEIYNGYSISKYTHFNVCMEGLKYSVPVILVVLLWCLL